MSVTYTEEELKEAYDDFVKDLRSLAWQVSVIPSLEEFRIDFEASLEQQQEDTPTLPGDFPDEEDGITNL